MRNLYDPDKYMSDLRQILSQGRKRIGLFIGAGAPMSIVANNAPLIPDIAGITRKVIEDLDEDSRNVIEILADEIRATGDSANVEKILTRIRLLADAIGSAQIHNLDRQGYQDLEKKVCGRIGECVSASLPRDDNPYSVLVSWIGGTHRAHPIEIFTTNYDLLLEEAFERAEFPYFDGFTGSRMPFFDPASVESVENDLLPARWSRVWKLHGSLGWKLKESNALSGGKIAVRTGNLDDAGLIYPTHLKYDQATQMPYSALFARLRKFLLTPDSLLICTGFSLADSHIASLFKDALAANKHTAILVFQYKPFTEEDNAVSIAKKRANLSVYAPDGAVVGGASGRWHVVDNPPKKEELQKIRRTYWAPREAGQQSEFLLGDFAKITHFFSLAGAEQVETAADTTNSVSSTEEEAQDA